VGGDEALDADRGYPDDRRPAVSKEPTRMRRPHGVHTAA
jgi:hypothetical protein